MKLGPLEINWSGRKAQTERVTIPVGIGKRSFAEISQAGQSTLADWLTPETHINDKLRSHLPRMVRMCRSLADTNKYFRRFLSEWTANVIGSEGLRFQSMAAFANGKPDETKQLLLEEAYARWQETPTAWANGICYHEGAQLAERTVARDGMVFIRKLRGYSGNPFRFSLQMIPMDYLDLELNGDYGGKRIRLGCEIDTYGRTVAYYLGAAHGSDDLINVAGRKVIRVSSDDMICRFYREQPEQLAGIPMAVAAIIGLRHLDQYEEAEVVAARVSACASLAMEREFAEEYTGEDSADLLANLEISPGGTLKPPAGVKLSLINPTHPNGNYGEFRKAILKGAAAATNLPYARLAADASESNYSSMREERLAATDIYRMAQHVVINQQERPIFEAWLQTALLTDELPFLPDQYARLLPARWQPRGWDWVDPQKEIVAVETALKLGLTSRRRELAKRGIDMEELDREIEADTRKPEPESKPASSEDDAEDEEEPATEEEDDGAEAA